jgi:hypothetical protein
MNNHTTRGVRLEYQTINILEVKKDKAILVTGHGGP